MIMKSFLGFPHTQVWRGDNISVCHLLGSDGLCPNRARIAQRLRSPEVRKDLLEFNARFATESAFWSLYLGPGERFQSMLADVRVISDDYPWIEYALYRSLDRKAYLRSPAFFSWPPYQP